MEGICKIYALINAFSLTRAFEEYDAEASFYKIIDLQHKFFNKRIIAAADKYSLL